MTTSPTYDLLVFGATGFAGALTAEYLAAHAPAGLRWALVGRNADKLARRRAALAAVNPDCAGLDLIECDVLDAVQLADIVPTTRAVITTIGPYIHYGEPLLAACAEAGTDYLDLTGEPEFVDSARLRYDATARASGARIVNCCGFDSIPHDLGALFSVGVLPPDRPVRLQGYVRAGGTVSGGTWHSAIHAFSRARRYGAQKRRLGRQGPRGSDGRKVGGVAPRLHRVKALDAWGCPFPTIDGSIVKRSARALPGYGPDFRYGHNVAVKHLPVLLAGGMGMAGVFAAAQLGPTRRLLLSLKSSGDGPDAKQRARGWFEVTFVADVEGRQWLTRVSGGDPGYGETAKMLAESALCLLAQPGSGPARAPGGVITPAVAFGTPLIERLQAAGIRFEVIAQP